MLTRAAAPPAWRDGLAPGHARDANGALTIGGANAGELAETYGTPLHVVDLAVLDASLSWILTAAEPFGVEVAYAAKAFVCVALARHLSRIDALGIDVCSLGELLVAERAGFPAVRITLHGAGKSGDELQAAFDGRAGTIVVDSLSELRRLAALGTPKCSVVLRVNTEIEAHTHAFVRTGGDDTKFGIHRRDWSEAAATLNAHAGVRFAGLHGHAGSQIYESGALRANAEALVDAAAHFANAGVAVERVICGGGFGVQMDPATPAETLDVAQTVAEMVGAAQQRARTLGIPAPRIGIEPGRAIVANAGTTLYRTVAVKRQTNRTFVVVDGGMFENPRPALYGAYHHVATVARPNADLHDVTVCGRSCENDELGPARLPAGVREGDLLASCTTGAYTFSMAGNYNRFVRPAVVAVRDGEHQLWVSRESFDDVLARDVNA